MMLHFGHNSKVAGRSVIAACGVLLVLGLTGVAVQAQVITEFSAGITASAQPDGIIAGPDGNLWFTEFNGSRIGRMTPSGVVTEFSAGMTANAQPVDIVAGPDGNLWFTEYNGNRIGRITTAGVITEFGAGMTADARPESITAGSDGNLWFTEAKANKIGRITPAGVITEFSSGLSAGASPAGIAAGPDGNVWFTEYDGNRIGRITRTGVVTEFSAGISSGAYPFAIVAGPDGNVWFTEGNGNRIGRITPAGSVSEFASGITANAGIDAITAGPDGNLWFTEFNQGANRIGRITAPPALALLENPQPGSFQSGIGLLSGWSCQGPNITVSIDGQPPVPAPYGSPRGDTASTCGASNTSSGFGLLFNFNTLGGGPHTAQLFVNGVARGNLTQFMVTVPAGEFLTGQSKQIMVPDFPVQGRSTVLVWQQSLQNFAIQSAGP